MARMEELMVDTIRNQARGPAPAHELVEVGLHGPADKKYLVRPRQCPAADRPVHECEQCMRRARAERNLSHVLRDYQWPAKQPRENDGQEIGSVLVVVHMHHVAIATMTP